MAAGAAERAEIKDMIEISKRGIETIIQALCCYNEIFNQNIPWKSYKRNVLLMDQFRHDFSYESAQLVGDVTTLMKHAEENYISVAQSISEWCKLTTRLLKIYLGLFENHTSETYEAQRSLLFKILNEGLTKMSAGQAKLEQCSMNFKDVAGKLRSVKNRLTHEFENKSSFFQESVDKIFDKSYVKAKSAYIFFPFGEKLMIPEARGIEKFKVISHLQRRLSEVNGFFEMFHKTICQTHDRIESTKRKLNEEIKSIGVLKVQIGEARAPFPMDNLGDLRHTILKSVNDLIKICKTFQKDYGKMLVTFQSAPKELVWNINVATFHAQLVGEVSALIKHAEDNYFSATRSIYDWCSLTTRLLKIYLDLFENRASKTYEAQRALLIYVFEDGLTKMSGGQAELEQCCLSFNNVAGKLTSLHIRVSNLFDYEKSFLQGEVDKIRRHTYVGAGAGFLLGPFGALITYSIAAGVVEGKLIPKSQAKMSKMRDFFEQLHKTIEQTNVDIDSSKEKMKDEVRSIAVLKFKTERTKALIPMDDFDGLRDTILESVNNLIKECEAYQKRA
ncbi:Hemolysin E [Pseudolycoriella hygida]|uniref:Hemolysin E n=1 Tax=Pseudolycoriella hygida TaxID=35572 RepID=A0A9Q0S6A2_9DIPT|nr:Hemolysin E [Pseudolycoriella hygida]